MSNLEVHYVIRVLVLFRCNSLYVGFNIKLVCFMVVNGWRNFRLPVSRRGERALDPAIPTKNPEIYFDWVL